LLLGSPSGLMDEKIIPAVREYYNENEEFKKFIDNISLKDVDEAIECYNKTTKANNQKSINKKMAKTLFDLEYITLDEVPNI
jgi:hypothetical protein